jgi:uncharacterized membrane protein (DUF485 family)
MLHGPAAKLDDDQAAARKSKLGLKFFLAYGLVYAGFIVIGVFNPGLMGIRVVWGLNLAIFYGFGLIILAILMGFLYHIACSRLERKLNHKEEAK